MRNSKTEADHLVPDDEYINGLAADWYFLDMFYRTDSTGRAELVIDPLIECGLRLKRHLKEGGHTFLEPLNVCADEDLYFDIWLDADGDIQAGELFMDEH